jgi:hypothetical protein
MMEALGKRYRVFFNRRGAPKGKVWCVDEGLGTRKKFFESVTILVPLNTEYSGLEPDWVNPVAWMEARGKLITWRTSKGREARIGKPE